MLSFACLVVWSFSTLGVGLLDFKVNYYSSPLLVRSMPAETTSRDCLECSPPKTTVRVPVVPNPQTTVRLPGVPKCPNHRLP